MQLSIIEYLDETRGAPYLLPKDDPVKRQQVSSWIENACLSWDVIVARASRFSVTQARPFIVALFVLLPSSMCLSFYLVARAYTFTRFTCLSLVIIHGLS